MNDVRAVIGVGDNADRQSIATRIDMPCASIAHLSSVIAEGMKLGVGKVVCAGAVVQTRTTLQQHVIVKSGAVVDHDCEMGPFAQIDLVPRRAVVSSSEQAR